MGARGQGRGLDACPRKASVEFLPPMRDIAAGGIDVDHDKWFITCVGELVKDPGWDVGRLAGAEAAALFAEAGLACSRHYEVQLFLLLVVPGHLATPRFQGHISHAEILSLYRRGPTGEVLCPAACGIASASDVR